MGDDESIKVDLDVCSVESETVETQSFAKVFLSTKYTSTHGHNYPNRPRLRSMVVRFVCCENDTIFKFNVSEVEIG